MARNTCFLCGDKLVNGYCTSCGFSNKRAQKIRYRLNPSESVERINGESYKKSIKEQVKDAAWKEEKKKSLAKQLEGELNTAAVLRRPEEKRRRSNTVYQKRTNSPKSAAQKANTFKAGIAIIAVLIGLFAGPVSSFVDSVKERIPVQHSEEVKTNTIPNDTHVIPVTGESFETQLGIGNYEVGVDIPEGTYNVSLISGSGGFVINDPVNYNYIYEYFDSEDENSVTEIKNIDLYEGAMVMISFAVQLQLESDNAQIDTMHGMKNPVTEEHTLKQNQSYTAGVDFPEGIYDVQRMGEQAWFQYKIPADSNYYEGGYREDSVFLVPEDESDIYYKVVLPKGTVVTADYADIKLIPSSLVGSDDYGSYYSEYQYE